MPTSTTAKATATRRTRAIQISTSRQRASRGLSVAIAFLDSPHSPFRLLAEQLVLARQEGLREDGIVAGAGVAESHERVPAEIARIVARHIEPVVPPRKLCRIVTEPVGQPDVRLASGSRRLGGPAPFDPAIPRTDVLADVAAVDLCAERLAVVRGDGLRGLRPVRQAPGGIQHAWFDEGIGRTGVDAERARAAAGVERSGRLDLR